MYELIYLLQKSKIKPNKCKFLLHSPGTYAIHLLCFLTCNAQYLWMLQELGNMLTCI